MSLRLKVSTLASAAVLACMLGGAQAAEFEIRGSHSESVESPLHKGWLVFEAYVESASGGRIAVNISPAGQLGGIKDGLEQAKVGAIQLAHGDEQTLDSFYRPMMILATPYLFANDEEAQKFLHSAFFMDVREKMAKESGLRLLASASYGFRCFTNNVKPIKSAADMKGIRMRVPPSPMSLAMVEAMGGSPTPVPWEELYGAMQQGVVDGQENPLVNFHASKLYEVQKHLAMTNHQFQMTPFLMSKRSWDRLADADRKLVQEAAAEATALQRRLSQEADEKLLADLKAKGVQVTTPAAAPFAKATAEVVTKWASGPIGPYVKKVVAAAQPN